MKRRTQQCIAAFAITGIVILGLCGFVAVDLSTDAYMPGQFASLVEVYDITDAGMRVTLLGKHYIVEPARLDPAREKVYQYRGYLPHSVTLTAHLAVQGYLAAVEYVESLAEPEEPW